MNSIKTIAAAGLLSVMMAAPAFAQEAIQEPGLLVVVADEEASGDELDRATTELGEYAGQRDQLGVVGVVGRDPATVVAGSRDFRFARS